MSDKNFAVGWPILEDGDESLLRLFHATQARNHDRKPSHGSPSLGSRRKARRAGGWVWPKLSGSLVILRLVLAREIIVSARPRFTTASAVPLASDSAQTALPERSESAARLLPARRGVRLLRSNAF